MVVNGATSLFIEAEKSNLMVVEILLVRRTAVNEEPLFIETCQGRRTVVEEHLESGAPFGPGKIR